MFHLQWSDRWFDSQWLGSLSALQIWWVLLPQFFCRIRWFLPQIHVWWSWWGVRRLAQLLHRCAIHFVLFLTLLLLFLLGVLSFLQYNVRCRECLKVMCRLEVHTSQLCVCEYPHMCWGILVFWGSVLLMLWRRMTAGKGLILVVRPGWMLPSKLSYVPWWSLMVALVMPIAEGHQV